MNECTVSDLCSVLAAWIQHVFGPAINGRHFFERGKNGNDSWGRLFLALYQLRKQD